MMSFVLTMLSCRQPTQIADVIFINSKVVTLNSEMQVQEAVAIKGDRIIAVGSNENIKMCAGQKTNIIDVNGKTIIPGLVDAHTHPEAASISEIIEEIPDVHTVEELLEWIKLQTSTKRNGEWIIHPKLFYTRLKELRQPTLDELDRAAPANPVFLNGSFGGVINTEAIKISGLDSLGHHEGLIRNSENGKLTGVINSSAFKLLKIPPAKQLSPKEEVEALKKMFNKYNSYGITGIISGYGNLANFERFRSLHKNNELTVRVMQNFLLPFNHSVPLKDLIDSLKTFPLKTGDGDEWVRAGSLKIFLDGGILTGTAYLSEPWGVIAMKVFKIDDPGYKGIVNYTQEEVEKIAAAAIGSGWAFTAHSTGGGGVGLLLNVFEHINRDQPIRDKRFSIIHGNFFSEEAIEKMAGLGVISNIQPAWFYKDAVAMNYILGEKRAGAFHPNRSMQNKGIILAGGSDHMVKMDANTSVNPYNPFLGMWSVITRKTEDGNTIMPEEALSREDALKMYTINNAYSTFEEDLKGTIEPGKLADLVVLSADFLTCPEDMIKEITADLTMVGGKIVYKKTKTNGI